MSFPLTTAASRLSQVKDTLTFTKRASEIPWDPESNAFPTRRELPKIDGAPDGAAWVWGENDNLGRINLLTPARTKTAAAEIKTGEVISLNLPLDVPKIPGFTREHFKHTIKDTGHGRVFDDTYTLNTQSGTQWDGFRHFSHLPTGTFYNGVSAADINGPKANLRDSIHYLSEHGIAGRGILLDYRSYAQSQGTDYDPFTRHEIPYSELVACGKAQGIDIRPAVQGGDIQIGDMLFIRSGFVERYKGATPDERKTAAERANVRGPENQQRWAGVQQSEEMLDWLHDCYFSTVAGDAVAFEAFPALGDYYLHEHLLALWGVPIGEMVDLEKLSQRCHELKRWTFFVASAPANCVGGIASHVNGLAIL